ncbi:hypothetical protein BZG01_00215 [Labilibaculum manganireducens]|uniref:Uncharacterized protein n=1 Tax=Labilibaculum manganireducens TaxID=1940525 RepID=A0A2N3IGG6_9BACT|nr:hypothetical protein [Labilibaculum manganireducens]PKQ69397.1 hypothetical protein BZG01_00215 [Labilibaculum manganireducens]
MTNQSGKKQEPRTTLVYKGETYPFYITNRGRYDFENSGHSDEALRAGNTGSMLAQIYHQLRDCAKRASMQFDDSFEDFIDNSDRHIFDVFEKLLEAKKQMPQEDIEKKV